MIEIALSSKGLWAMLKKTWYMSRINGFGVVESYIAVVPQMPSSI